MEVIRPTTAAEVETAVRGALSDRARIEVTGSGTRRYLGAPVMAERQLSLAGLDRIVAYEPEELVLTVEPGLPMTALAALLARHGQHLPFEPPVSGTIGGVVAANLSGPRRMRAGAARDFVLGVSAISGFGEKFKAGGQVVKNVTGYDIPRLLAGSFGTLAVITRLTLKVLPAPSTSATIVFPDLTPQDGCSLLRACAGSAIEPSGCAYTLDGRQGSAFVRIEGARAAMDERLRGLEKFAGRHGDRLDDHRAEAFWRDLASPEELLRVAAHEALWRLSVPMSHAPAILAAADRGLVDCAGGRIWVIGADGSEAPPIASDAGSAMLYRAPETMRRACPLFSESPAVDALARRVKAVFDPHGLLNPGRMRAEDMSHAC